jgi:hypothetical protein
LDDGADLGAALTAAARAARRAASAGGCGGDAGGHSAECLGDSAVERRNQIALIRLNRPIRQNRLDPPTRLRLAETLCQCDTIRRCAVVLVGMDAFSRGSTWTRRRPPSPRGAGR